MTMEVPVNRAGGPIFGAVRVLVPHIGVSALDIWLDTDGNGRPDRYHANVKPFNQSEGVPFAIGNPDFLFGNILQWTWMASKTPGAPDTVKAELILTQDGKPLQATDGTMFPLTRTATIRNGANFDIAEWSVRFVST